MEEFLGFLFDNALEIEWRQVVMWLIGGILIFLAIKKDMEPSLLLPMGFGAILVNLPLSGAITQVLSNGEEQEGILNVLFDAGIGERAFPAGSFYRNRRHDRLWAAAFQPEADAVRCSGAVRNFLYFGNGVAAGLSAEGCGFDLDYRRGGRPTSIFVANMLKSDYFSAIMVAAYSYMALVPIIQPPVIKLITTKKERMIRMPYEQKDVSKLTRIMFPIVITIITGIFAPTSVVLIGFLMFGNLIRECGVLDSLSETAQKVLANLITIFLGITVASQMTADKFLRPQTIMILAIGLVAFIFDTVGGVCFAKILNLFLKKKINPMIGAAGISAFPMSARVVHKMGLQEDPQNFLLMHSIGVNVSGQIASVIAGGMVLNIVMPLVA